MAQGSCAEERALVAAAAGETGVLAAGQWRGLSALDPTGCERLKHAVEDAAVAMEVAME